MLCEVKGISAVLRLLVFHSDKCPRQKNLKLPIDLEIISNYNVSNMERGEQIEKLRSAGLTPTPQRLAVLEYLDGNRTHPTADEIYRVVHARHSTIVKATVYNALSALKKAGVIQELTIEKDAARYDSNPNPHPHFLCRVCGKLYDIDLPCMIHPGDEIDGHQVEEVHTYIYGVCAACRKKELNPENNSKSEKEDA